MHRNDDSHKIIKSAIYNDLYQYLNTSFSATISMISFNKVPMESLIFDEDSLIQKPMFLILPS